MPKEAVFSLKLDSELRAEFMAEAAAEDRPASQVMRELMRDYVEIRRQARVLEADLQRRVRTARASIRAGHGPPNEEVEAIFAAKRRGAAKT